MNSVTSLAYGCEFPLSGLHAYRLEQAREAVAELLHDTPGTAQPFTQ